MLLVAINSYCIIVCSLSGILPIRIMFSDFTRESEPKHAFGSKLLTVRKIFPSHRSARTVGPGVELQDDPVEWRKRSGQELDMYTSLE